MNENLDLTKILDGCPEGTKFYSATLGTVSLRNIISDCIYPILVLTTERKTESFTKGGKYITPNDGECTLFPSKDQRDWSKFERFWDKSKVEKFDPKTLERFDKVLVRSQNGQDWIATFFSHMDNIFNMVVCGSSYWKQCIPYNYETKNLVSTDNDCPEYYKWWEE